MNKTLFLTAIPILVMGCKQSDIHNPAQTVMVTTQVTSATSPVTLTSPDQKVSLTLPTDVLADILTTVGGGAATVTITVPTEADIPKLLTADELATLQDLPSLGVMAVDITSASGTPAPDVTPQGATNLTSKKDATSADSASGGQTQFKVTVNSTRRCTPGTVDLYQIIGKTPSKLSSYLTIDDGYPQTITGYSSAVVYTVKHFIFAFGCPRTITGGTSLAAKQGCGCSPLQITPKRATP